MKQDCGCTKNSAMEIQELKDSNKKRRGRVKNRMRKAASVLDNGMENVGATLVTVVGNRLLVAGGNRINDTWGEAIGAGGEMLAGIAIDELGGNKNKYAAELGSTMAKHGSVELVKELGAKNLIDNAFQSIGTRVGNFFRGTSTSDQAAIQAAIERQAAIDAANANKQLGIGGGADF